MILSTIVAIWRFIKSLFISKVDDRSLGITDTVPLPRYKAAGKCSACKGRGQPSKKWGSKHVHSHVWRATINADPSDAKLTKYGACLSCGRLRRRGRSPRNAQGREEERAVMYRNADLLQVINTYEGWLE
jgi:hypothetical protein